jgi:hypothetical protein
MSKSTHFPDPHITCKGKSEGVACHKMGSPSTGSKTKKEAAVAKGTTASPNATGKGHGRGKDNDE